MDADAGKGFEVGLNPCTTPAVRARDGQSDGFMFHEIPRAFLSSGDSFQTVNQPSWNAKGGSMGSLTDPLFSSWVHGLTFP